MKRKLLMNAFLLLVIIFLFVYNFFILEMMEPGLFYLTGFLLLVEAIVFLTTFVYLKKTILNIIRKILLVYCIIVFLLLISSFIYTTITGYVFIYAAYRIIYISFLLYPLILLIMVSLLNKKESSESHRLITGVTSSFVVCLIAIHGLFCILGVNNVEVIEIENNPNQILVTDTMFLHGTTYEYKQVNLLYMEYEGVYDSW